jgi:hypothetical protein
MTLVPLQRKVDVLSTDCDPGRISERISNADQSRIASPYERSDGKVSITPQERRFTRNHAIDGERVRLDAGQCITRSSQMSVKITMNGRPFNARDFKKQLEQDVLKKASEQLRKQVEAKLREVKCPDHPTTGKVHVEMSDLKGGQIRITPCCEKVADEVQVILAEATPDEEQT